MNEHQQLFMEEASELFSTAYDLLLPAEEADELGSTQIDELFRVVHTIKGSSGGVEFDHLSRYTHLLENLLDNLRDGTIGYTSGMAGFLVDSIDKMQDILDHEFKKNINEDDFEANLGSLEKKILEYSSGKTVEKEESNDEGFVLFGAKDFAEIEDEDDGFVLFNAKDFEDLEEERKPSDQTETKPSVVEAPKEPKETSATSSIRVDLTKVDQLLNRVGELVITNSMLGKFSSKLEERSDQDEMNEKLAQLERHIRELQDAVMSIRMIPMEHVYAKIPKLVRDLSRKLGKKARLSTNGASVEIDKMMIEGLNDPLMHILRNAIDHGLEDSATREIKGKDPVGTISVMAMQENGQMVISISDDGAGINLERVTQKAVEKGVITQEVAQRMSSDEKADLIFSAGLSTASEVSDVSGRGVGMDVVRTNIAKLGGIVRVRTSSSGTKFTIILPLTLAILDGLTVSAGTHKYILPLSSVVESLQPLEKQIKHNGDGSRKMLMLREQFIPIIELYSLFGIEPKHTKMHEGMLIVLRAGDERFALFVDEFGSQQQVVVKSLEKNFKRVRGVGGATVQGDGTISLILDPLGIIDSEREKLL